MNQQKYIKYKGHYLIGFIYIIQFNIDITIYKSREFNIIKVIKNYNFILNIYNNYYLMLYYQKCQLMLQYYKLKLLNKKIIQNNINKRDLIN